MWIMGGVFERFPRLRLVFVEPGLGWVAWWLMTVDDMVLRQGYDYPALSELPSFYFHRNVALTFIEEPDAIQLLRHRLGSENLLWSTDYPHPVTSWPHSRAVIDSQFEGVAPDERELMLSANAARIWHL
jgi:predicted TIM-barrel fold metal-dependent hydrolase